MSEKPASNHELTPEQAADVIRYYNDAENAWFRQHGQRDKVHLGQSALHTTMSKESITGDGVPALTSHEMGRGMDYISPPERKKPKATDEMIDHIVDTQNVSYYVAIEMLRAEGYDVSDYVRNSPKS